MFIETLTIKQTFLRCSKLGRQHQYTRLKTVAKFLCDNCQQEFSRDLGSMDRKRLSNDYYHVCSNCDSKRFAQGKATEHRRIWNMSVDSELNINKF